MLPSAVRGGAVHRAQRDRGQRDAKERRKVREGIEQSEGMGRSSTRGHLETRDTRGDKRAFTRSSIDGAALEGSWVIQKRRGRERSSSTWNLGDEGVHASRHFPSACPRDPLWPLFSFSFSFRFLGPKRR